MQQAFYAFISLLVAIVLSITSVPRCAVIFNFVETADVEIENDRMQEGVNCHENVKTTAFELQIQKQKCSCEIKMFNLALLPDLPVVFAKPTVIATFLNATPTPLIEPYQIFMSVRLPPPIS